MDKHKLGPPRRERIRTQVVIPDMTCPQLSLEWSRVAHKPQFDQLISVLLQEPETSFEWKQAMNQLLLELQQSPEIIKSSHPDYSEALHKTWEWLSRRIREFKPRQTSTRMSLINWVNGYLRFRIRDLYAPDPPSLDAPVGTDDPNTTLLDTVVGTVWQQPTLDQLDQLIAQEQQQQTVCGGQLLKQRIQQDPGRHLRNCYPRQHPDCHCHFLVQKRLIQEPPLTFVALAEILKMDKVKLTNHWYGRCLPCLQRMANQLGYTKGGQDE